MADNDKKDVLKDVQEFIKANPNNGDVDILIQAMEKAIQDNYILDRDAIEVLDFVDRYKGGICVSVNWIYGLRAVSVMPLYVMQFTG